MTEKNDKNINIELEQPKQKYEQRLKIIEDCYKQSLEEYNQSNNRMREHYEQAENIYIQQINFWQSLFLEFSKTPIYFFDSSKVVDIRQIADKIKALITAYENSGNVELLVDSLRFWSDELKGNLDLNQSL